MLAYINESLKADKIKGLEDDALETLWQQINRHKSKRPILVGAVYRPPSRTAAIDWNFILRQLILESKRCIYLET